MVGVLGFSQQLNYTIDTRLTQVYGETQIAQMQATQPQTLAYLNFYVQHGYEIMYDLPAYKWQQFEDITTITNTKTGLALTEQDIPQLNILLLDITRGPDQYLTYRIGETGNVIVFLAPNRVLADFNQQNQ